MPGPSGPWGKVQLNDAPVTGDGRSTPGNSISPALLGVIVESSSYPTLVVDAGMALVQLNQDAQEVLRAKGGGGAKPGEDLADLLPGESYEAIAVSIGQCLKGRGGHSECKVPLDMTGKRVPVLIIPVGIDAGDGKRPGQAFLLIFKMEGRRSKDMQAAKLATLGEFAAGIAHELNTPLASISLIAENLLDEVKDEEVRRQLRKILTQVEFSARTVQEILAFARKENPTFELVDLRKVLDESLEKVRLERKYRLRVEVQDDLPKVKADPFQLQEVLINILRNAKDAMKDGGDLTLRLSADGDWVEVAIGDSGEGIPTENLGRIFQPFFTTKAHGQGVGLGLSICQRIISNHRGELLVSSKMGKGTTFTVRLPRGENA